MRISDWSSDVCSSDLVNFFGVVELLEGLRSALAASSAPRAAVVASSVAVLASDAELDQACANLDEASARARVEVLSEQGHGHAVYPGSKAALAKWGSGRASGRERGWQYGLITGVGVTLK